MYDFCNGKSISMGLSQADNRWAVTWALFSVTARSISTGLAQIDSWSYKQKPILLLFFKISFPEIDMQTKLRCSISSKYNHIFVIFLPLSCLPGSKEPLLEQRIPATYLALEECVTSLAAELREPVLKHDEYRRLVREWEDEGGPAFLKHDFVWQRRWRNCSVCDGCSWSIRFDSRVVLNVCMMFQKIVSKFGWVFTKKKDN